MSKRGRKSEADLSIVSIDTKFERLKPPSDLSLEQRAVFADIVGALPGNFFSKEQMPLLASLSRHITSSRRLSGWIDRLEGPGDAADFDPRVYLKALESRRKETSAIKSLSTALRLTNQSRWRPSQAGKETPQKTPPWEM